MDIKKRLNCLASHVNEMLAIERDVAALVRRQIQDPRLTAESAVHSLLEEIEADAALRLERLQELSANHGQQWGDLMKGAIFAATSTLESLYVKVRQPALSQLLRDDHVALNLAATSYAMLYSAALAYDNDELADLALDHLNSIPPQIMRLTRLLPELAVKELADDDPQANLEAVDLANEAIALAWLEPSQQRLAA